METYKMTFTVRKTAAWSSDQKEQITYSNIEARDLDHAGIRAAATMRKHGCFLNCGGAFLPFAFVETSTGETYRVYADRKSGYSEMVKLS